MPHLPYLVPAAILLCISALWYMRGGMPRLLAVLPVTSCYVLTLCMLFYGGSCHRVAHLKLTGLEMDLRDRAGEAVAIPVGGKRTGPVPTEGVEVPGLPPHALEIVEEKGSLLIRPGPGYQRGILVRSGGVLVPLEPGGVPKLVPIQSGDVIKMPPEEAGDVAVRYRLGKEYNELTVTPAEKWIGSNGAGLGKVSFLPAQFLRVKRVGADVEVAAGPGWTPAYGVVLNGIRRPLAAGGAVRAPYVEGVSTLAVVMQDPLAGQAVFSEEDDFLKSHAWLDWESANPATTAYTFTVVAQKEYAVGGTLEDDMFVKGLSTRCLTLTVGDDGVMKLEVTRAGEEDVKKGLLQGTYPQVGGKDKPVIVGTTLSPYYGAFFLMEELPAVRPAAAEPSESGASVPPAVPVKSWKCAWQPDRKTQWQLPNRTISLPLAELPMELFSRRPWTQRTFPLSAMGPRETSYRSAVVYTPEDKRVLFNGASLLQLEPGIDVSRGGESVVTDKAPAVGLLKAGAELEFLTILADREGEGQGSSTGNELHPAEIYAGRRVAVQRSFASASLETRQYSRKEVPVLKLTLRRPQTRSVSMTDVKEQREAMNEEAGGTRFGINDQGGFSDLPHQISFPLLTRSFDEANADVTMNWFSFEVQDDYRKQSYDYGEPFQIGGGNRMDLMLTKETIHMRTLLLVAAAGLLATFSVWVLGPSFWWMSLCFGVAFLTCNRVVFGQAVHVNPPFNAEVLGPALWALVLAPVVLFLLRVGLEKLLPGRISHRLEWLERRLSYPWIGIIAALLLLLRGALLVGLGAKEALTLGGFRVALSVVFVPLFLLLFAQCCYLLWKDKERAGGFLPGPLVKFGVTSGWLFFCQSASAVLTSDLGMFLYFIPMALLLALLGCFAAWEGLIRSLQLEKEALKQQKPWIASIIGLVFIVPLASMLLLFTAPKAVLGMWPGLHEEMASQDDLVTDSTLLRVLQFADEEYLVNLGTDTAERILQDHDIMASYAHRGMSGVGYLNVDVLPAKSVTALNDNVSAIFIFAQFGTLGALAVIVAYLAVMLGALGAREKFNTMTVWLALLAGMSFALVSLYMMAANRGLLPFTGRNMYLLGLNSVGDLLESTMLLGLIILGLARVAAREPEEERSALGDILKGRI